MIFGNNVLKEEPVCWAKSLKIRKNFSRTLEPADNSWAMVSCSWFCVNIPSNLWIICSVYATPNWSWNAPNTAKRKPSIESTTSATEDEEKLINI